YNYASGNTRRMKKTFFFTARISLSFLFLVMIAYLVFAGDLVRMFMDNEQIVAYGTSFLRGMCLAMPFLCMDFLAVGVFQACGLGREACICAVLREIVLEIPALFILNCIFPLYGIAYAQRVAEVILAAAAIIVLARLFRRLERHQYPG